MRGRTALGPRLTRLAAWVRGAYLLLPVGHMGALYYASSIPGGDPRLALGLPDYMLHGGAYATLALLWRFALSRSFRTPPRQAAALAWFFSFAYGVLDEIHQSFVPGRDPSVSDLAADGLGAGMALLLLALVQRWLKRRDGS